MKKYLALLLALLLAFSLFACGKENPEDQPEPTDTEVTDPDVAEAGDAQNTSGDGEEEAGEDESIDLSGFSFGVAEDGENVLVAVKNDTEMGEVACVITYVYTDGELEAAIAEYYVPDEESAEMLAEQLWSDGSIIPESIEVDGPYVFCQLADDQLTELRQISREELIQVMEYTIQGAQGTEEG